MGVFGATSLGKNEVNLFRDKILDVVANLALFRDDVRRKLVKPIISEPEVASLPSPDVEQPEVDDFTAADHFAEMEIDHDDSDNDEDIKNEEGGENSDLNDGDDNDYNANEEDFSEESVDDDGANDNDDKQKSFPKKATAAAVNKKSSTTLGPRIFSNLPPLPFSMPENTSKHKKFLIQTIVQIPPCSSSSSSPPPPSYYSAYTLMLQRYPWNYNLSSDSLTLATDNIPIAVIEPENKSSIALECSSSTCNFSTVYTFSKHNSRSWKANVFELVRKMFQHVVTSHLDGFPCPLGAKKCVRKMGSLEAVCQHLERVHYTGRRKHGPYHCSICGKGMRSLQSCLDHEETHKDTGERELVTCDACGKQVLPISLQSHKREYCEKLRPPRTVCQLCGKSFSRERTLKAHMLRLHAGEEAKTFVCEVCGNRYADEGVLRNHKIYTHRIYPEGVEAQECRKGCGKKFTKQVTCCKHEEKCDGVWRW